MTDRPSHRLPTHTPARLWLVASYAKLGEVGAAAWEVQELPTVNSDFALSRLLLASSINDPNHRGALTDARAGLGLPE